MFISSTSSNMKKLLCILLSMTFILGSSVSAQGLVKSHGTDLFLTISHADDHHHGQASQDQYSAGDQSLDSHKHHGGDHSHESAFAVTGTHKKIGQLKASGNNHYLSVVPFPCLLGLERPPKV
jgi:hypothetical protein